MPCTDPWAEEESSRETARKYSEVVPLLCSACIALEGAGFNFKLNPALDAWWTNHVKEDQKREAEELKEKLLRDTAKNIAQTKTVLQMTEEEKRLLRKLNYL